MCGLWHQSLLMLITNTVIFIDDYSHFIWIYFFHSKDEVFSIFKIFHAHIQTQFSAQIKILRFDNKGEYVSFISGLFTASWHHFSTVLPFNTSTKWVVERKNRHLLDVVRTLLLESSTPSHFLCEALSTAVHLINKLPSPHIEPRHSFYQVVWSSSNLFQPPYLWLCLLCSSSCT